MGPVAAFPGCVLTNRAHVECAVESLLRAVTARWLSGVQGFEPAALKDSVLVPISVLVPCQAYSALLWPPHYSVI